MFGKRKNYLKQIYKVNPESNAYIIEVSLENYNEIFNGWDPSPIKRRDLDPDLVHFMEECALDIPLRFPLELQFQMPGEQYDERKEELSRTGIQNNFNFTTHFIRKDIKQTRKKVVFYIITAFAFLSLGYISGQRVEPNIITTTLMEGLSIGGWVFLWEAFSLLFFSGQETYGKLRRYERFQNTIINFEYK
jgi:hypothetical protein